MRRTARLEAEVDVLRHRVTELETAAKEERARRESSLAELSARVTRVGHTALTSLIYPILVAVTVAAILAALSK